MKEISTSDLAAAAARSSPKFSSTTLLLTGDLQCRSWQSFAFRRRSPLRLHFASSPLPLRHLIFATAAMFSPTSAHRSFTLSDPQQLCQRPPR
jgi:hypothetical protein